MHGVTCGCLHRSRFVFKVPLQVHLLDACRQNSNLSKPLYFIWLGEDVFVGLWKATVKSGKASQTTKQKQIKGMGTHSKWT